MADRERRLPATSEGAGAPAPHRISDDTAMRQVPPQDIAADILAFWRRFPEAFEALRKL